MSKQRINIIADGSTTLRIPAVKKFITVDNDTDATITIYDNVGMLNPANILYEIKPYSARCYPLEISQENEALYTMGWNGTTYPNYFDIMLTGYDTHNNLLYPQAGSSNVTVVADSVGIARTGQLPSTLSTAGNLKVGINETFAQLPAALSGPGGVNVSLLSTTAYTWQKLTFAAAGDSAVLGTDIAVVGWECSGTTTAYPLDGAAAAWKTLNNKEFILPLHIAGTFTMHADAACDIWVLFMP